MSQAATSRLKAQTVVVPASLFGFLRRPSFRFGSPTPDCPLWAPWLARPVLAVKRPSANGRLTTLTEGQDCRERTQEVEQADVERAASGARRSRRVVVQAAVRWHALGHARATLKRRHWSGTPLSVRGPRSSKWRPEPTTRSFTVDETSTWLGSAADATRAPR